MPRKRSPRAAAARGGGRRRDAEVLATATDIFHKRGYSNTSVQDVADALGILKGSLYYYIDSKEDLLHRLFQQVHEEAQEILDAVDAMGGPAIDRLAFYIRSHVAFNARNLKRIAVYYHDFEMLTGARKRDIVQRRRGWERRISALIDEAKDDGALDAELDTLVATSCVLAQVIWIYTWYRPGGPLAPEELGERIAHIALNGLLVRPAA